MKINWKVRIKNKSFWVTAIPAALLLVQAIAAVFDAKLDFGQLGNQLLTVVNTAFSLLAILGVVNDPTTAGVSDSQRAMAYTDPVVTDSPRTVQPIANKGKEQSQ